MKRMTQDLTDMEREILSLRREVNGKRRSLEEVSAIIGVTREKVRQIEAIANEKLRSTNASLGIETSRFDLSIGSAGEGEYVLSLEPGKHVLVCGTTGAGKTILFKRMVKQLALHYPEQIESIVVYDSKGCEYRSADELVKTTVFQGEKSDQAFFGYVEGFLASNAAGQKEKMTLFFIDEGYLLSFRIRSRRLLKRLFRAKKKFVVILSSQVIKTLKPFVNQSRVFIQFRPRCDQPSFSFIERKNNEPLLLETGECIIKQGTEPITTVACYE